MACRNTRLTSNRASGCAHPLQPAWGVGQVQSVIGSRVTVNFTNAGKLLINAQEVTLEVVAPAPRE